MSSFYINKITKLIVQSIDTNTNQNLLVQVVLEVDLVHREIELCAKFCISLFLINSNSNPVTPNLTGNK